MNAPATHAVEAFVHLGQQARDITRVVLQIGIGGYDDGAARGREPGGEAGGLAEVAAEADDAPARVGGMHCFQALKAAIATAVVDHDDLVATADPVPVSYTHLRAHETR